ncbi:toxin-antitoxin system HicB family antitoxin [Rhodocista pekingensis]|uniref:Toxin-antitoxin system HicB family antitoxin n=1 Tax=Rhodocista pekingensis TaxID=201185 RepID=A0ABW2KXY3_9PROT
MSTLSLRLPDDLKAAAAAQAERSGVSLNAYITAALAGRVAAQAQTEEFFRRRAAGARRDDFLEVLEKAGRGNPPAPGDGIDGP